MKTNNGSITKVKRDTRLCLAPFLIILLLALAWPAAGQMTLISTGAVWKYFDSGFDRGTAWSDPGYNDTTWASGPAPLGYGNGGEATVIHGGPTENKFITTWFRRVFSVPNSVRIHSLQARLLRDDGAVVYLNGVEVFRSNMPAGPVTYNTLALSTVGSGNEGTYHASTLSPVGLATGLNVLAVEIHQVSPASSDIAFDFELLAYGTFSTGSDGSYGEMNITANTTLDLPPDGVFRCTTITVAQGATLQFNRNALNTPVYLLATGDVLINGRIDVSGVSGQSFGPNGGASGPGGFDGGNAGGDGHGPGGGRQGVTGGLGENRAGGGAYSTRQGGQNFISTNLGIIYGSQLLVPLVGGSGGGGSSYGGGGGGGAILIASDTRIDIPFPSGVSAIYAIGGFGPADGSGGAIRLLAPVVAGAGRLSVPGGSFAGYGRVRVDTIDRTGVAFDTQGAPLTIGSFLTVFPPSNPRLDIIETAGTTIPEGTDAPVIITLPFGSETNRTVVVQARNLGGIVPIEVVLTPNTGPAIKILTQIDNAAANPATVTVPVGFPINTPVRVNAWIR